MNGKRARALRKVAAQMAWTEVEPDKHGNLPAVRYTIQHHKPSRNNLDPRSLRLGPCVRKIEKETKREFHNLTR